MPRRNRQSQSNNHDLVLYTKYKPKARLPPEYNKIKTTPSFKPLQLDPIVNPGPNLPTDIDLDDPITFFRLNWTDEVLQYMVDTTNHHVESVRGREDNEIEDTRP
jgi:hypothetical protein